MYYSLRRIIKVIHEPHSKAPPNDNINPGTVVLYTISFNTSLITNLMAITVVPRTIYNRMNGNGTGWVGGGVNYTHKLFYVAVNPYGQASKQDYP